MTVERISAITIKVNDMAKSVHFYNKLLRLKILYGVKTLVSLRFGHPAQKIPFLDAISDPTHPEHKEFSEWIGGDFDPEAFDVDEVNRRLCRMK